MPDGIQIQGPMHEGFAEVLSGRSPKVYCSTTSTIQRTSPGIAEESKKCNRHSSMGKNLAIQKRLDPFVRETVSRATDDPQDRRCEITGPVEAKMMINAMNSGARVFMWQTWKMLTAPTGSTRSRDKSICSERSTVLRVLPTSWQGIQTER